MHGAKVTAHYNTNATSLDGLIDEFGADNIQKSQGDLGVEGDTIRMFGEINEGKFGPVQVVIVNHATYVAEDVPLSQMSLKQWDRTINANLTSSFLVIREYLKGLGNLGDVGVRDKAAIILVGSTAGKYGESGHVDYSATKSGKLLSSADFQRVLMKFISHDVWPHDDAEERTRQNRTERTSKLRGTRMGQNPDGYKVVGGPRGRLQCTGNVGAPLVKVCLFCEAK